MVDRCGKESLMMQEILPRKILQYLVLGNVIKEHENHLGNGDLRCVAFENTQQCNQELGHLGEHHYGIDSMLSYLLKYEEPDDYSVQWVREVRDNERQ